MVGIITKQHKAQIEIMQGLIERFPKKVFSLICGGFVFAI